MSKVIDLGLAKQKLGTGLARRGTDEGRETSLVLDQPCRPIPDEIGVDEIWQRC